MKKLEGLSSKYFHASVKHVSVIGDNAPQNKQLFHTVGVLDAAIDRSLKVTFTYNSFGTDKELHPRLTPEGAAKRYSVSPYQMVVVNGRYYLICSTTNHLNVSHYRIDKITDIELTEECSVPMRDIKGLEHGLNLPRHLVEHMNMLIGEAVPVTFRFNRSVINEAVDTFGTDIIFSRETEDTVDAMVCVNRQAMKIWALQHLTTVQVLTPAQLVADIREELRAGMDRYTE